MVLWLARGWARASSFFPSAYLDAVGLEHEAGQAGHLAQAAQGVGRASRPPGAAAVAHAIPALNDAGQEVGEGDAGLLRQGVFVFVHVQAAGDEVEAGGLLDASAVFGW